MRQTTLKMPVVAALAVTRGMLGAGVALLLGDRIRRKRRKKAGWGLFLTGAVTTLPLGWLVMKGCRQADGEESAFGDELLFDFARPRSSIGWRPVDDVIMGGRSSSRVQVEDGALVFTGNLSLEQGGGFASIRSPEAKYDLSECSAISLRVRGDDKTYKLGIRTEPGVDTVVHQVRFSAPARWTELVVSFQDFSPSYHGQPVQAPPLNAGKICSFSLLISDRQEGPFRMEVAEIRGIRDE